MANEDLGAWEGITDINLGYVYDLFEKYQEDASSIDSQWRRIFEQWENPKPETAIHKAGAVQRLAQNIRNYGHLAASIDPLDRRRQKTDILNLEMYELKERDLKQIPAEMVWPYDNIGSMQTAFDVINRLKEIYTKNIAFQFSHVHGEEERDWLNRMVETGEAYYELTQSDRLHMLEQLIEVEDFEKFIHRTFVGQKRFSVEGLDVLIPMVEELVRESVHDGVKNVMIGMAHRGRLNMLAHVLGKPYESIFSEFQHALSKELVPSESSMGINYGWTGDVKYHLGADLDINEDTLHAHLRLANNPSHLEYVNPVVVGFTRAAQEDRHEAGSPKQDTSRALSILIHGDAAFPGEGIVAETINLSRLPGYNTGGTIHMIANNRIGFTTEIEDARSTEYASDLAKGFEIPIVHVNADDPEACLAAVHLAHEYRKRFKKDFLIDLIGYRRFGHNEMDDPAVTQPRLYQKISNHPTVRTQYAEELKQKGVLQEDRENEIENKVQERLQQAYEKVKTNKSETVNDLKITSSKDKQSPKLNTAVSMDLLHKINKELLHRPDDFNVYTKLERILQKRLSALDEGEKVDWALAETLAFATILHDGTPIRLTGQDTERGTFAHRHLVLHDQEERSSYTPLQSFPLSKASFALHNSPLSEAAVLGFEYGYNVFTEEVLDIWEAQFGDFVNAAQVILDQFISAGRAKWGEKSSMILLLPHGYEGQGPEHSSARLERFLQMAAENNYTVANVTSAAQYFHLLRRQAALVGDDQECPLIIMTPKSLLRNPRTASHGKALSEDKFQLIAEEPSTGTKPEEVKKLIICSGKIAVDLQEELENTEMNHLHILRIEQLYPFPKNELIEMISSFTRVKEFIWVQEEPQNMGAWTYIEPKLRDIIPQGISLHYVGRPERSSPAEGVHELHKKEQGRIIKSALSIPKQEVE